MDMPELDFPIAERFDKIDIADICRQLGPTMVLDATDDGTGNKQPLDGVRLMWAMAGNESSFGYNCTPRFEPAYWNGRYSNDNPYQISANLTYKQYGAASWTPWQVMARHALRFGFKLEEFVDLHRCGELYLAYMKHEILQHPKWPCHTLDQIGDSYNSGNYRDSNVPEKYIRDLKANYNMPLPQGRATQSTQGA